MSAPLLNRSVSLSLLLAAIVMMIPGAVPAAGTVATAGCDFDMAVQPGYDPSGATRNHLLLDGGDVVADTTVCGGPGDDVVGRVMGTFIGRGGDDRVDVLGSDLDLANGDPAAVTHYPAARFVGGGGHDRVTMMQAGVFVGGNGKDVVATADGPVRVVGGPGNDRVGALFSGVFIGGHRQDVVRYLAGGRFEGRLGGDIVRMQSAGRFVGGPGFDRLTDGHCGGRRISVERVSHLPACMPL